MTLEAFKGVEKIGDFELVVMDELREKYPEKFTDGLMNWQWFESEIRPNYFVTLRRDKNSLTFTLQNGAINEHGVNGCQVDTLLHAAKIILQNFNARHPCRENSCAITRLDEAIHWLDARTKNRIERGVEGFDKP